MSTAAGGSGYGSSIDRMLGLTVKIAALRLCEGFPSAVRKLKNPSEVSSALFAFQCAAWCAQQHTHRGVVFEPPVRRKTTKYPDFLWETTMGAIFCECKSANAWERRETKRLQTACGIAARCPDAPNWPSHLRLDVRLGGYEGASLTTRLAVLAATIGEEVSGGSTRRVWTDGTIECLVRNSAEPIQPDSGWMQVSRMTVGPTPTNIMDSRAASVTVSQPLAGAHRRMVRDLIKQAKTQLPLDGPGAVFVETGSTATESIEQCVREVLENPANRAVVWTAICADGSPQLIAWQNEQPFDNRLFDETAPESEGPVPDAAP